MNLIAFSGPRNCVNTQYAALSGAMITFQLLEMSSITTPNQTVSNVRTRYIFSFSFLKNIDHNEKSIWKVRVNGIVSVTGFRLHVYQIS